MPRIVAHLDMDAFFAAIEERDTPALRGVPLVVGADPRDGKGRGVVSTSNYLAREYGIHSATPISTAWRLSEAARRKGKPPVTFVPVDMKKYVAESDRVMAIIHRFVPLVEQASIDEAYGDLSFTGSYEAAEDVCRRLKKAIRVEEQLTASAGIGPNKLIAKIASGMHKPDGLTVVREGEAEAFLAPLSVRAIPGIGPKAEAVLARHGVRLVEDLKRFTLEQMRASFGKRGLDLYEKVRGRDDSPIETFYEPKSVGEQETFEQDTLDSQFLVGRLRSLCQGVIGRLHQEGFRDFRTVVLTVRFADFDTKSRSHTLTEQTADEAVLQREALKLLMPFLDRRENPRRKSIRLLGVRVEKIRGTMSPDVGGTESLLL
jgi:DNA polymerase IV (DinB-like DNA polymerase)